MKKALVRILSVALLLCLALSTLPACAKRGINEENFKAKYSKEITDFVLLHVKYTDANNKKQDGKIVIQLFPEYAPITVANFQSLVDSDFYDGLTFHRTIKNALIQGGDPKGTGRGNASTTVLGEFSSNGVQNPLSHVRGTVSMARALDPNSASCQFFILSTDHTDFDGNYAAFGQVIYGMETVDALSNSPVRYNVETGELSFPKSLITIVEAYFVTVEEQYTASPTLAEQKPQTPPSTVVPPNADTAPKMEDLDMTEIDVAHYQSTDSATDLVRMNVSYTDRNGTPQTGSIVIRLYEAVAPKTVANFQALVSQGFYNGLTFHRILSGGISLLQGGDPYGNGTGGSGKTVTGEFESNGFVNNLSHVRGVISMARAQSYNSASCQFFILNSDRTQYDGSYAAFGYVVYGMETVGAMAETETTYNAGYEKSVPVNPVTILSAEFLAPIPTAD